MSKIQDSSSKSIKSIAKFIALNFKTENDKIRAVFYFTASKISYDVEKYKNIILDPNKKSIETDEDRIQYSLINKKGVCANYAAVFSAIANELNIKTFIVEGYTKQFGKISNLSHAWCASK
ncbi:MAG: transglutaminase domain-containing protein, partial [Flavobacterium sp.]|nr:transglutaminase domain-containing protein [Flavobacterium sp.]